MGSCEGRVFDERELKFELGDGEGLGFPVGVEKAIMAMEQEEEALFYMKPKYDPIYSVWMHFLLIGLFYLAQTELLHFIGLAFSKMYNRISK